MEHHRVEGAVRVGQRAGVALLEAEIADAGGQLPRPGEEDRRGIEPDDGRDPRPSRQLAADSTGAASRLQHPRPVAEGGRGEERVADGALPRIGGARLHRRDQSFKDGWLAALISA